MPPLEKLDVVSTGEIVVGPCKTLFMDEISTGLDSSTTYQIVRCIRNMVHLRKVQPPFLIVLDCQYLTGGVTQLANQQKLWKNCT